MGLDVEKLKSLLGIEGTEKDTILSFVLDDVTEVILNYCHINTLPTGLEHTAYRMAMDIYRNENIGTEEAGSVSSMTEGTTSVSFKGYLDDSYAGSLLKNYKAQLVRYRKVAW